MTELTQNANRPIFQTLGCYTTTEVMDDLRELIWLALEIELKLVPVPLRQKLAAARALYEQVFDEHGGKLGSCPWAKDAPKEVGTANPGIKWDLYDPRRPPEGS